MTVTVREFFEQVPDRVGPEQARALGGSYRFDIDGAYNMRYEIVKKRIDKALIKGTNERLTQPGKIAIVYSQPQEALEYRGYIEYLQASGYLTEGVEEVELEELPGAQGLQALRVTVEMHGADAAQRERQASGHSGHSMAV